MTPELAVQAMTAAGDAIVTVDVYGHITTWNHGAESLFGHREDQAVGQGLTLIIPEVHVSRHVAAFRAAVGSGALKHGGRPARVEALTARGQTMPLLMSLGLLVGPKRQVDGVVAVLRRADIQPEIFVADSSAESLAAENATENTTKS